MIDTNKLGEALGSLVRVGNLESFVSLIRALHHDFLKSILLDGQFNSLSESDLRSLFDAAEFLATYYTNVFVGDRASEITDSPLPNQQLLQDGRSLAGTIYEYLGDHQSRIAGMNDQPNFTPRYDSPLPTSSRLYLKAALMYGLGLYEARTHVIMRALLRAFNDFTPAFDTDLRLTGDFYLLQILAGNHSLIRNLRTSNLQQWRERERSVQESIQGRNGNAIPLPIAIDQLIGIKTIAACIQVATAFVFGQQRDFDNAMIDMTAAIALADQALPETRWTLSTIASLLFRLWKDSPWARLGPLIDNRSYLRALARRGISTLWSSQIAALEMKSGIRDLAGGYLDERLRRVVLSMPTSAGKTLIAEIAIAAIMSRSRSAKCVYVAPSRALCDQIVQTLSEALVSSGIKVAAPVSDSDTSAYEGIVFQEVNVVVVTPEKLSYLYRQNSPTVLGASLFIFDEVHAISKADNRGWTYEEIITLLLSDARTTEAKMIFISAIMPNHLAIREWVDPAGIGQSVGSSWQPTRTLKGAVIWDVGFVRTDDARILRGDLVYVRTPADLGSPLRIEGIIESRQVIEEAISRAGRPYPKRSEELSDGTAEHAARLAILFERLGPVLVFAPTVELAENIAAEVSALKASDATVDRGQRHRDALDLITETLTNDHPLVGQIGTGVAFHHGMLPREVRSEIELLYRERAVQILASTTTLVEGLNLPIKTLLIADYCVSREYVEALNKREPKYPLPMRDYKNMIGRAGRAMHETEGQVVLIQSVDNFPFTMDRGFSKYLDLDDQDVSLAITSSAATDGRLELLEQLTEAMDSGVLNAEQVLFESRALPREYHAIRDFVRRLAVLTTLLDSRSSNLGRNDSELSDYFACSFIGNEIPNLAPRVLTSFTTTARTTIRAQLSPELRELFSRTGLPLSVCRDLHKRASVFWRKAASQDRLEVRLSNDEIESIAELVYKAAEKGDLKPTTVRSALAGEGSKGGAKVPHPAILLRSWIRSGSASEMIQSHFAFCETRALAASAFSRYLEETISFRTPWLLSAFWIFSRVICSVEHNHDLSTSERAKELALLPAFAKFGVDNAFAAFACTIGLGPSHNARLLAGRYYAEVTVEPNDFRSMLRWTTGLTAEDLATLGIAPAHISRMLERMEALGAIATPAASEYSTTFAIAGWQYYDGPRMQRALAAGDVVTLITEPDNRFDSNAVAVFSTAGERLGFLPRSIAPQVRQYMGSTMPATVSSVHNSTNPNSRVFVTAETLAPAAL